MVNIAILTSSENTLNEKIITHFQQFKNTDISCIITNKEDNKIFKKLRRYHIKEYVTHIYKDIDDILMQTNTNYIVLCDYDEKPPPNFCEKYYKKLIEIKQVDDEIIIKYINHNFNQNDIIFRIGIKKHENVEDLINRYYPIVIENLIRNTYENK